MGLPLWCTIAASGRINTREKFLEEDGEVVSLVTSGDGDYQSHLTPWLSHNNSITLEGEGSDNDLMVPNRGDYCMAVFLVIFGAVVIVAGI